MYCDVWAFIGTVTLRMLGWSSVLTVTSHQWEGLNIRAIQALLLKQRVHSASTSFQLFLSFSQKKKKKSNPLSYFCFVFTKIHATWKNHISPPSFQAQTLKLNVFKTKWNRQSQGTYPETRVSAKTISFPGPDAQWLEEILQNSSQTVSYRESLICH